MKLQVSICNINGEIRDTLTDRYALSIFGKVGILQFLTLRYILIVNKLYFFLKGRVKLSAKERMYQFGPYLDFFTIFFNPGHF